MMGDKEELTAQLVVDGRTPSQPVLSPDGRWVVFVVATVGQVGEHPVSALWVAAADGSTPPQALTAGLAKDSAPRWAPDSESVFFLSDRAKQGTAQLHRIRLAGGEAEALTSWQGGIRQHLPLADPELVAVVALDEPTEEDERRKKQRDDAKVWGERVRPARLRLLDLRTREVRTPAAFGDRHVIEVAQQPGGGPLAAITWATPEADPSGYEPRLHLLDLDSGTTQDLGRAGVAASFLAWWHAENGWHVAYLAKTPLSLVSGDALFDVAVPASGETEHRNLTSGMTVCPLELVQIDSGAPLALFADGLDTTPPARHRRTHLRRGVPGRGLGFGADSESTRRHRRGSGEHGVRAEGRLRRASARAVDAAQ
jgi:dipeptidyl aminopeptidase/acylaminoacyl peptidase